jgi:cardiolipin synthase A/B
VQLKLPRSLAQARELIAYSADPSALRPGHRIRVLIDGSETFPAMLQAIGNARRYVHLETYILRADRTGRTFAAALSERAKAGVQVRLLYDGFGAFPLSTAYLADLRRAGVQTVEYRPMRRRQRWTWKRWLRRDHRKILVVDGEQAFVGGINIADDYSPRAFGGKGWRDTHALIRGPVVDDLEEMFRTTWHDAGGEPYRASPPVATESVATADSELAVAVGTDLAGRRGVIRRHLVHAIRSARHYVYIANAYFVPDQALRRALRRASRRGVDVRLILPGESDVRSVQWAGERSYTGLLRDGVRVNLWLGSHMHAKTVTIDDAWASIGSYNLDYMSLFWNMEVVVEVVGEVTTARLRDQFHKDLDQCQALEYQSWRRRSWWRRLRSWFFYRFRRFL